VAGGRLSRLELAAGTFAAQVFIVMVVPDGDMRLHGIVHLATCAAAGTSLLAQPRDLLMLAAVLLAVRAAAG